MISVRIVDMLLALFSAHVRCSNGGVLVGVYGVGGGVEGGEMGGGDGEVNVRHHFNVLHQREKRMG